MSFTPNMSQKDIADLDKERGKKFYDEEDHFPDSDLPKEKKPWLNKTPVNKGNKLDKLKSYIEDPFVEDISKPLPEKKKRDGESNFQHKIRQWTEEVKERPDRFPGGKDQAIAIAAKESGVAKKSKDILDMFGKGDDVAPCDACEDLKKFVKKAKEKKEEEEVEVALDMEVEVEKALNSRSMYVPRPVGPYDPYDISRSATSATTRGYSRLRGPDGVAPLVGDTFRTLEDDANTRSKQITYKSCQFHGLSHRSDTSCMMCFSKSDACEACGSQKEKTKGGMLSCKACG